MLASATVSIDGSVNCVVMMWFYMKMDAWWVWRGGNGSGYPEREAFVGMESQKQE